MLSTGSADVEKRDIEWFPHAAYRYGSGDENSFDSRVAHRQQSGNNWLANCPKVENNTNYRKINEWN